MNVTLYRNINAPEEVNKENGLTQIGTAILFNEIGEINILEPDLLMAYDGNTNLLTANYCFVDLFHRYYFIRSLTLTSARRLIADCYVDPLMSWKTQLKECNVLVVRNEFVGLNQIVDTSYPINPGDKSINRIMLPGEIPANNAQFILTIM